MIVIAITIHGVIGAHVVTCLGGLVFVVVVCMGFGFNNSYSYGYHY